MPNYLENQDGLRKLGVDEVMVWCVNDGAVMQAWAKNQKIGLSMVRFYGDPSGDLTRALDMEMTHPGPLSVGIIGRCKRHAIHAVDGIIKVVNVSEGEDDPAGDKDPSATLADAMIEAIKSE